MGQLANIFPTSQEFYHERAQGNSQDRIGRLSMIKNERQLHVTRTLLERLEQDLTKVKQSNERPSMRKLQESALIGQIEDLKSQIREYEEIWGSHKQIPELKNFDDLPNALVKARLSLGLTQKE